MTSFDPVLGFVSEDIRTLNAELAFQVQQLREDYDQAAAAMLRLRAEDEGWSIIGQVSNPNGDGFALHVIKEIGKKAEVQQVGNPLLKRAFELRFNPIFSRGFEIQGEMKPRYQRKLDNPTVKDLLFSTTGWEDNEKVCFNVGNLFIAIEKVSGDALRIPFKEITNRAVDPNNPGRTAYYLWEHTVTEFDGTVKDIHEWIPTVEWIKAKKGDPGEIAHHPTNHGWTIVDERVNVPTVGHWGVPDVFPALPYAWAYSEYIRDSASLLKALSTIAWKVVGKSKAQAQNAGVQLSKVGKPGSVAAMTAGTELAAMPKAGQVDMADGLALAGMVASATGVNVSALANVAAGATAANIQSLDGPTVAMARARQERWKIFYGRIFDALGIEDLTINFPKITEDPIHRQVSSLATARSTGALWADEYRESILEALSIKSLHDEAPEVNEYAPVANALGFLQMLEDEQARQDQIDAGNDPVARVGNSGVNGKQGEIDNTNRNRDSQAGSGTQTDLVG